MRADRAAASARIEVVVAEVVGAAKARVVGVGRERERRATRPATYHLGGDPHPLLRVARPVGSPRHTVEKAPEPGHVLPQLAEDEVAAVAPEVGDQEPSALAEGSVASGCRLSQQRPPP